MGLRVGSSCLPGSSYINTHIYPSFISPSLSITSSFQLSLLWSCLHITMVLGINRPAGEVGAVWPAIAVGTFVAFGGVLFGT
jgi:hypothetical protein